MTVHPGGCACVSIQVGVTVTIKEGVVCVHPRGVTVCPSTGVGVTVTIQEGVTVCPSSWCDCVPPGEGGYKPF